MLSADRLLVLAVILGFCPSTASAYIDAPPTLGRLVRFDGTDIAVLRVEKVSKEKRVIIYQKVKDLKGKLPDRVKHHISDKRLFPERVPDGDSAAARGEGPPSLLDWATPGKEVVFFHDAERKASATCIGPRWHFGWAAADSWWALSDFEDRGLAWAYVGSVDKLAAHVSAILARKEVVVPAAQYDPAGGGLQEMWDHRTAYQNLIRDRRVRVWRIRAGWEITSFTGALDKLVVGMGSGDREAVPGLRGRLKHADHAVRRQAAEDLGQIGAEAKDAVPDLIERLKDSDSG